jgi:outer membrane lipoprotein-sorting protein
MDKFVRKPVLYVAFFTVFLLVTAFKPNWYSIEKISLNMTSRQVQDGKSVIIKGEVFYQRNGNLTTHFTYPKEYLLLANKEGETKIYDPLKNTVIQYQNFLFSTESSKFAYFFSGRVNDMGLNDIGYAPDKTSFENNLRVTEWRLRTPGKDLIQKIKLVYDNQKPIYMDYRDVNDQVIRKVFYYNYANLAEYQFPTTTTEVVFTGADSAITKTTYTDIKINDQATSLYFNFSIPANAKNE